MPDVPFLEDWLHEKEARHPISVEARARQLILAQNMRFSFLHQRKRKEHRILSSS